MAVHPFIKQHRHFLCNKLLNCTVQQDAVEAAAQKKDGKES